MRLPWRRGERASSLDLLVVGLGNPGREYARNRHNVGWMVVDELARRHGGSWRSKFYGSLAEVRLDGHRVALLKPETYMNESGRSVAAAASFFKVEPDAILVVHDEGDFDLGRLQARKGGGLAGHNGLRSIAQALGTQDFLRLRIGVGRPERGDRRPLADYVLSRLRAARRRRGDRRARGRRGRDARRRGARAHAGPLQLTLDGPARRRASSRLMVRNVEQRPVLFALVRELLEHEQLAGVRRGAADACARVRAGAAARRRGAARAARPRADVLVPEDADARDLAEAAAWFLGAGARRAAAEPRRPLGLRARPPPHLVGERARALDVLEQRRPRRRLRRGRGRGAAAAGATRPEPLRIAPGDEQGIDALTEALALAGYERVERAEERGQFAVRGGLVDVFPTTGREPLRIEFFGDEIEQVRAFSPFTQRALHPVDDAVVYPAAERRLDLVEPTLADDEDASRPAPDDLVAALPGGPDLVWEAGEVRQVWEEERLAPLDLRGASRARPASRRGSRSRSRRSGPRSRRAACPRPRTS